MQLVERERALQTLQERLELARVQGQIALVSGEAGIGKTSLLKAVTTGREAVWWGACDALQTPEPLSPLLDIARHAGARFADKLTGPRAALFDAVLDELRLAASPLLVVIEDVHWADEATLDLLKFVGRRIERTRALLVITYRDDEVPIVHPLRRVIGDLPAGAVTRIPLQRLSPAGVDRLARHALRAPAGLFDVTQGNPFFLNELLRHPDEKMPATVQDLVLTRFARLCRPAQALACLVSIVPTRMERRLLDVVLAPETAHLAECIDSGLLLADEHAISFRHELARVAIESAVPLPVAQSLHAQVLRALEAQGHLASSARLTHHAALAGDDEAVRRYAPLAADEARSRGAHREAALQLRIALRCAGQANVDERRRWLEAYALDSGNVDWHDEALAARSELDQLYRAAGDIAGEAGNLSRIALLHVYMMRNAQADAASRRAIELLESLPPGPALATAYGIEASLRMLDRDCGESVEWSRKAVATARVHGDRLREIYSLSTQGTARMFIDYDAGCRAMEEVLAIAEAEKLQVSVANLLLNLGSGSGELMRIPEAERWLRRAIAYAAEHELDGSLRYSSAWLALCEMHLGRWAEAAERAGRLVDLPGTAAITRVMALVALGRLRQRRGDPGVSEVLDEALALAGPADTLQRSGPVRAARAEAAFGRGDVAAAAAEAQAALPLALQKKHSWFIGELAYWSWRAGALDRAPAGCAQPYALQIAGEWQEAAQAWERLSCPYERARALAHGDATAQQEALAVFEQLGARPAADAVRKQLRDAGVRGVTRGARASTLVHPHGLTTRELQVLRLLCEGMRNAEIAQRLCRSVRTVDHHLASVFAKLGVDSRVAAIEAARRAGVGLQSGQSLSAK